MKLKQKLCSRTFWLAFLVTAFLITTGYICLLNPSEYSLSIFQIIAGSCTAVIVAYFGKNCASKYILKNKPPFPEPGADEAV
jgi:hypothetical protein